MYHKQNSLKQEHRTSHATPTIPHRTNIIEKRKNNSEKNSPKKPKRKLIQQDKINKQDNINKQDEINKQDKINPEHTKNQSTIKHPPPAGKTSDPNARPDTS